MPRMTGPVEKSASCWSLPVKLALPVRLSLGSQEPSEVPVSAIVLRRDPVGVHVSVEFADGSRAGFRTMGIGTVQHDRDLYVFQGYMAQEKATAALPPSIVARIVALAAEYCEAFPNG